MQGRKARDTKGGCGLDAISHDNRGDSHTATCPVGQAANWSAAPVATKQASGQRCLPQEHFIIVPFQVIRAWSIRC